MRRFTRVALAVSALTVPALVAAGCGDSKTGGGTTTVTALTADEWRTQADAICKDIDTRGESVDQPSGPSELQAFLEQLIPLGQEGVDRLKALTPPAEVASFQTQAVSLQQQAVDVLKDALERVKNGEDPTKLGEEISAKIGPLSDQLDQLADDAGLTECGSDDDDSTDTTTDATTTEATTTEATTTEATTEATTTSSVTIPTTGNAEIDKYLGDVQQATSALTAFGQALQAVTSPDDIKSQVSSLRGQLGDFDAAIADMDTYTLSNATLEGQRSRLVAAGPKVSDTLREFVDVAASVDGPEDLSKLTAILPKVSTALQEFSAAAQP
ncbi:MAG: hypothetical protein AB1416_13495 [Actinomycetota bacterium]